MRTPTVQSPPAFLDQKLSDRAKEIIERLNELGTLSVAVHDQLMFDVNSSDDEPEARALVQELAKEIGGE